MLRVTAASATTTSTAVRNIKVKSQMLVHGYNWTAKRCREIKNILNHTVTLCRVDSVKRSKCKQARRTTVNTLPSYSHTLNMHRRYPKLLSLYMQRHLTLTASWKRMVSEVLSETLELCYAMPTGKQLHEVTVPNMFARLKQSIET